MRFKTNVQNICKLQPFNNKLDLITMRKLFLLLIAVLFFSCEKNETNECFGEIFMNAEIYLDNPEFISLKTGPGAVIIYKNNRSILLIKNGIENATYRAFDLECPNHDCPTPMTYDGSFTMTCSCDQAKYSIIDGYPQNNSSKCFAYEYNVRQTSASTLIITGS